MQFILLMVVLEVNSVWFMVCLLVSEMFGSGSGRSDELLFEIRQIIKLFLVSFDISLSILCVV